MEGFIIELLRNIFGTSLTYLIMLIILYMTLIYKIKRLRVKNNEKFCKRKITSHAVINYIDYVNKYKIRNLEHSDKGKEKIMRTLFKCFIDSLRSNISDLLKEAREKKFQELPKEQVAKRISETFDKTIEDYRMLFKQQASSYLDNRDIERILGEFREINKSYVISTGKIIIDLTNSNIYRSNCEVVCSLLDLALSAVIQISLNIETIFIDINGSLIGKEFKGEKILT